MVLIYPSGPGVSLALSFVLWQRAIRRQVATGRWLGGLGLHLLGGLFCRPPWTFLLKFVQLGLLLLFFSLLGVVAMLSSSYWHPGARALRSRSHPSTFVRWDPATLSCRQRICEKLS